MTFSGTRAECMFARTVGLPNGSTSTRSVRRIQRLVAVNFAALIDDQPTCAGWSRDSAVAIDSRNPLSQIGNVVCIRWRSESTHHRRRGVRMSRRNHDLIGANRRSLTRKCLDVIDQELWHHATVDDNHRDSPYSIIQHQCPGAHGSVDLADLSGRHSTVHIDLERTEESRLSPQHRPASLLMPSQQRTRPSPDRRVRRSTDPNITLNSEKISVWVNHSIIEGIHRPNRANPGVEFDRQHPIDPQAKRRFQAETDPLDRVR